MQAEASWGRRLLLIPPLLAGVAAFVWLASGKQPPNPAEARENARSVRIIEVPALDLVPLAEGYGSVEPARIWSAVAEVPGRIVEVHPDLDNGAIMAAGTVLARIDPVSYELTLAQAQAQLAELDVEESNARASLEIEQRSLQLAEREFRRLSDLRAQGSVSQSDVDAAERNLLAISAAVQNLRNTLNLIPVRRRVQTAQIDQARRDLAHTTLKAPFDLRIANLAVEIDQFVGSGQKLFEGDSVDRVEVVAQVTLSALRNLIPTRPDLDLDPAQLNRQLAELTGFRPLLRLDLGGHTAEWDAEFVRLSDTIDPQTRTLGVVVAVDQPFAKAVPGLRPPLSKGMFVQVLIRGQTQAGRILLPPQAIRDGAVLVADENDRLRRRPVVVAFEQRDLSVIASGLEAGERVVISDLVPAVAGMLLRPQIDEQALAALRRAAGTAP